MSKTKTSRLHNFYKSVWLFPSLLFIVLAILTACKISGTSVGIFYPLLYGSQNHNSSLIAGKPQPIRSDEFLFVTQLTIAQHAAGYPRMNPNLYGGTDMSIVGDAPYKDWSAVFRPENLAFFALPLEYAFALKWWLLLFLLITSCYFFVLRLFPGKRLLAALLATAFSCSPFVFWWYQTATLAPLFYGFFMLILGMRIINQEKIPLLQTKKYRYSLLLYVLAMTYVLTSFALLLYPPFLIPVAFVVAAFLLGYLLQAHGIRRLWSRTVLIKLGAFLASLVLALILIFAFIHTRSAAIKAIENTAYPGHRLVQAGGESKLAFLSSYLQAKLQYPVPAAAYYTNQSEASDFFMFVPFLLLPGFALLYAGYRRSRKIDWCLLAIQLVLCLFLAGSFLPGAQFLYHLTFLDRVPATRLRIGYGLAGIIQILLIVRGLNNLKMSRRLLAYIAVPYTLLCLAVLIGAGLITHHDYPVFVHRRLYIGLLALVFSVIIFLILIRRLLLASAVLLLLTFFSVVHIHPLYRGLGPLYPNNKLSEAMDAISKPGQNWVELDNIYYENFALMSDRSSVSGIQPYPELDYWQKLQLPQDKYIYNRYAHVVFVSGPPSVPYIHLSGTDSFQIGFTCSAFIEKNVQFALVPHALSLPCIHLERVVQYPAISFYLYQVR